MSQEGVRYQVVPVTADVAIRALGGSLDELLANAAWGMFDLICDSATVAPERAWGLVVTAEDPETLMVDALTELLVLFETEGVLAARVDADVTHEGPAWEARLTVVGETHRPGHHELLHHIKAVTYHRLEVSPEKGYALVLFDI
jgi:SHS2 domain-containing protein